MDRDWSRTALARVTDVLRDFHRQHPLAPGMPREEVRSREFPGAPPFLLDALVARAGALWWWKAKCCAWPRTRWC